MGPITLSAITAANKLGGDVLALVAGTSCGKVSNCGGGGYSLTGRKPRDREMGGSWF